jgi:hypothetical protein
MTKTAYKFTCLADETQPYVRIRANVHVVCAQSRTRDYVRQLRTCVLHMPYAHTHVEVEVSSLVLDGIVHAFVASCSFVVHTQHIDPPQRLCRFLPRVSAVLCSPGRGSRSKPCCASLAWRYQPLHVACSPASSSNPARQTSPAAPWRGLSAVMLCPPPTPAT